MPNAPQGGPGGGLSPWGDGSAPSDGNARLWLAELENSVPQD